MITFWSVYQSNLFNTTRLVSRYQMVSCLLFDLSKFHTSIQLQCSTIWREGHFVTFLSSIIDPKLYRSLHNSNWMCTASICTIDCLIYVLLYLTAFELCHRNLCLVVLQSRSMYKFSARFVFKNLLNEFFRFLIAHQKSRKLYNFFGRRPANNWS